MNLCHFFVFLLSGFFGTIAAYSAWTWRLSLFKHFHQLMTLNLSSSTNYCSTLMSSACTKAGEWFGTHGKSQMLQLASQKDMLPNRPSTQGCHYLTSETFGLQVVLVGACGLLSLQWTSPWVFKEGFDRLASSGLATYLAPQPSGMQLTHGSSKPAASAFFFGRPSAIIAGTETVKSPAARPRQVRAKSSISNLIEREYIESRILPTQVPMKHDRIITHYYIYIIMSIFSISYYIN